MYNTYIHTYIRIYIRIIYIRIPQNACNQVLPLRKYVCMYVLYICIRITYVLYIHTYVCMYVL